MRRRVCVGGFPGRRSNIPTAEFDSRRLQLRIPPPASASAGSPSATATRFGSREGLVVAYAPDVLSGGRCRPLRGWILAYGTAFLLLLGLFITHPPGRFTRGGIPHGDGVYVYAYARSIYLDGDVDFTNDYALLGNPHRRRKGPRGLPENRASIGPALAWAPTFALAQATVRLGRASGWTDAPGDGSSRLHRMITVSGSLLWGLVAAVFSALLARRVASRAAAATAGLLLLLATSLPWYMVYQPSWSHAPSAAAVAGLLWWWARTGADRRNRDWVVLGALLGVAALMRPQNVVFAAVVLFDGCSRVRRAWAHRSLRELATLLGSLAVMGLAALLAFAPQMWAWLTIYGSALTIPQGDAFMRWGSSRWAATLFSGRGGLFTWTPVTYLGVLGLLAGVLLRPTARKLAAAGLLVFAAQAYINGSVDDWWAGWAFGGRRYLNCTPAFGLGLALGLDLSWNWLRAHAQALAMAVPLVGLAMFGVCNLERMDAYLEGRIERGTPQSVQSIDAEFLDTMLDGLYSAVGPPTAAPASWAFAWRTGGPVSLYDGLSGIEVVNDRGNDRGFDVLHLPDPRWTLTGFSERVTLGRQPCTTASLAQARIALPLRYAEDLSATALLRPVGVGGRVRIKSGGRTVLDAALRPGWQTYAFTLPADVLGPGINVLEIEQSLPADPLLQPELLAIGTSGVSSPLDIELHSDPGRTKGQSHFDVGQTHIEARAEGVHMVVLGPDGLQHRVFDTSRSSKANRSFAQAVAQLPEGSVVAVSFAGHALRKWKDEGNAALAAVGARSLFERTDAVRAFALIGVKGAPTGSVVEQSRGKGTLTLRVGRPPIERAAAVGWAWVAVSRAGVEATLPKIPRD